MVENNQLQTQLHPVKYKDGSAGAPQSSGTSRCSSDSLVHAHILKFITHTHTHTHLAVEVTDTLRAIDLLPPHGSQDWTQAIRVSGTASCRAIPLRQTRGHCKRAHLPSVLFSLSFRSSTPNHLYKFEELQMRSSVSRPGSVASIFL